MKGYNISDDPLEIYSILGNYNFDYPMLLNINTIRKYWHSGAGTDGEYFDRYQDEMEKLGKEAFEIDKAQKENIKKLWQTQLEKQ